MISFLLPTRKRVALLKKALDCIAVTVSAPENVEVIIKVDTDDPDTDRFLDSYSAPYQVKKVFMDKGNGFRDSALWANRLAAESVGDILIPMADDMWVKTMHFDTLFPDSPLAVYQASVFTFEQHTRKSILPFAVTRSWFDCLGWLAPDDCVFADGFFHVVGEKFGLLIPTAIETLHDISDRKDPNYHGNLLTAEKEALPTPSTPYEIRLDDISPLAIYLNREI